MRQQPFASPEEALAHFGVKGMKWGVRKDRKGVVGVDPVTAAIGAAYVGLMLGTAYVSVREARRTKKLDEGNTTFQKNANVVWKKDPKLTGKMSVDDLYANVVTRVNPNYGAPGTKNNCRRCTFAYEMRRRGYDVKAGKIARGVDQGAQGLQSATKTKHLESVWGEKQISSPFALVNATAQQRSESIFQALSKHPEGARGDLGMAWSFGGGHSMAWEIINHKPVIIDAQNGRMYRDPDTFSQYSSIIHDAAYTRTDNLKLNDNFMRRWVENA